jgi:hypothetical protein
VVHPRDDDAVTVVRAFYEAVEEMLETGDATALAAAVASDHVEHAAAPGLPPTRDGLTHALRELRVTHPDLRLSPANIVAVDGRVVAQVDVAGVAAGRFLDLALGRAFAPWGPIDLFRVAGGQIVEHWGIVAGARFAPLGGAPLGELAGTPQVLSLIRWSFPAHTSIDAVAGEGNQLLVAATGVLTVTIVDAPGEPVMVSPGSAHRPTTVRSGTTLSLAPGASVTVPSATSFRLGNDTGAPAVAVSASLVPPGAAEVTTVRFASSYPEPVATSDAAGVKTFAGGVAMHPLAGSGMIFLPDAPAAIGVGRVILAGGAELPPIPITGPTLIALETGSLELGTGAGQAWVRRGDSGSSSTTGKTSLGAGDGAYLLAGTDLSLRNGDNDLATLLIFAVMPAAPAVGGDGNTQVHVFARSMRRAG